MRESFRETAIAVGALFLGLSGLPAMGELLSHGGGVLRRALLFTTWPLMGFLGGWLGTLAVGVVAVGVLDRFVAFAVQTGLSRATVSNPRSCVTLMADKSPWRR